MAKRTNRVAWGLAVVLATTLVGSVGALCAYGRQTGAFTVRVTPHWSVGRDTDEWAVYSRQGCTGTLWGYVYKLGYVEVEVPYRGPRVVLWTYPQVSTRRDTGR